MNKCCVCGDGTEQTAFCCSEGELCYACAERLAIKTEHGESETRAIAEMRGE